MRDYEARYLQLYTIDKSITFMPEGRYHGKLLMFKIAMRKKQPPELVDNLQDLYTACFIDTRFNVQIEVRVPLKKAMNETLVLTVGLVWLMNILHLQPSDGPASQSLAKAILPVTNAANSKIHTITLFFLASQMPDQTETEDYAVLYVSYGMIFFWHLQLSGNVPRAHAGGPFINCKAVHFLMGMSLDNLKAKYGVTACIVPQEVIAKKQFVINKYHNTITFRPEPASALCVEPFNLAPGLEYIKLPRGTGSDIDHEETEDNDYKEYARKPLAEQVTYLALDSILS
ncbi:hypothetical protein K435DRAFT_800409 [Dendrothele bispora CBS 962.96]|uniref:Uncharacterized protein n=1 Tax=Dendrothele bispora (strain CBS 962.96) TaxID=1314807 RepID=A0A4V4HEX4_DENBC|nr:hypothetical protein K435DRAFT_800409 [Dendrothele bispora CBS 962.96]